MNKAIKFRGRSVRTGEYVYGDLMHMTGGRVGIIYDKRVACDEVEPDSVAQLVGTDSNDKELYEGDEVIFDDGFRKEIVRCELWGMIVSDELFGKTCGIPYYKEHITLVEKAQCKSKC